MMLGREAVEVRVGGELVVLRPSLRVALALHRRHGGFDRLARLIAEGHLTTMADVVGEFVPLVQPQWAIWEAGLDNLAPPLVRFTFLCAGLDPDNPVKEEKGEGESLPHDAYLLRLFERATGWLGWSPEEAWNATPAEVEAACKGRAELLALMFGGSDKAKPKSFDDKLRLAFANLPTKVVKRGADA